MLQVKARKVALASALVLGLFLSASGPAPAGSPVHVTVEDLHYDFHDLEARVDELEAELATLRSYIPVLCTEIQDVGGGVYRPFHDMCREARRFRPSRP